MIKTYNAVFNEAKNKGVYGISLVEDPAMEGNFIALSKEAKVEFKTIDEEQRILIGLVLEPNKPIYRNQDGEEFNIVFSEQTVKDLSHNFFKQGFQTNSSIEHSGSIEGVSFVESWIVEDPKIDKSANFGFSYPKGSWLATMKVDSEEIWEDYVKSGKVLGFSVDAFVELQEVQLNKHDKMEVKEVLEAIKDIPNAIKLALTPKEEEVKLGSMKSGDGQMEFFYEGETPEPGMAVWMLDGDSEDRIPLPVGSHELEGGGVLVISEEGIIGAVEAKADDEGAELDATPATAPQATAADVAAEIKSVLIKYTEDAKAERLEFEKSIKAELETFKGELLEFSKEPAAEVIKSTPTQTKGLTQFLNNKL